jgi:hypothetical protein
MGFETRYWKQLKILLSDPNVCDENKKLFKKFFKWEEVKLKRRNNLSKLDNGCYNTLNGFIHKFRNVNKWFDNKPWKKLTKKDIETVYNNLEDGKILNAKNKPFKDRRSFYNKVFKSKPFKLAGKDELAKDVMEFCRPNEDGEVRFITIEDFKKFPNVAIKPIHKCLLWVAFDIGENINTLLRLKKGHFHRRVSNQNEAEYTVNLPRELLKRSRTPRTEITNFHETVEFLDLILKDLNDDDPVFKFSYGQAQKIIKRCIDITKVKCIPNGQNPTWKDLRSSMACYLLRESWSCDEVRSRLGHKPSSKVIDKYVNYLAINKERPKKKIIDSSLATIKEDLDESKQREKLHVNRIKLVQEENINLRSKLDSVTMDLESIKHEVKLMMAERVSKRSKV